jgi:hypothetical protein
MEKTFKHPYSHHPFRMCKKCDGHGWNSLTYHQFVPWVCLSKKIRCIECGGKGFI